MLGHNYGSVEHVTGVIKIFRSSLVTRDTQPTFKERVFFSSRKLFFRQIFANLIITLHHNTNVETQLP